MKRAPRAALRQLAGTCWLAAWIVVLYVVAAPWRHLGGVVDERIRWLEWFLLVVGLVMGFLAGRFARDTTAPGTVRAHVGLLRRMLYPLAATTALGVVALTWLDRRDPVGVIVTAFLAYWAGLDVAFGALPLMETADSGTGSEDRRGADDDWTPPWERY